MSILSHTAGPTTLGILGLFKNERYPGNRMAEIVQQAFKLQRLLRAETGKFQQPANMSRMGA